MRGLAALVLTIVLVVSGCGSDDDPQPAPSPTKSPTPSETTPTPPEMPEAARRDTKGGAVAFARHYVALLNHAQATGDVEPISRLEEETCRSCKRTARVISDLYEQGGSIRGGVFVVDRAQALRLPQQGEYLVELAVHFGPQSVDWPDPKPDQDLQGGRGPMNVNVVWTGSAWKVRQWTRGA